VAVTGWRWGVVIRWIASIRRRAAPAIAKPLDTLRNRSREDDTKVLAYGVRTSFPSVVLTISPIDARRLTR
jgi:hypothetical protein